MKKIQKEVDNSFYTNSHSKTNVTFQSLNNYDPSKSMRHLEKSKISYNNDENDNTNSEINSPHNINISKKFSFSPNYHLIKQSKIRDVLLNKGKKKKSKEHIIVTNEYSSIIKNSSLNQSIVNAKNEEKSIYYIKLCLISKF